MIKRTLWVVGGILIAMLLTFFTMWALNGFQPLQPLVRYQQAR